MSGDEPAAGELDRRPEREATAEPDPRGPSDVVRPAAPSRGTSRRRWRWWLGAIALAIALFAGLEAIPGVVGHDPSALLSELVASDAVGLVSRINPFAHDDSRQPCATLDSKFGTGNHLFKNRQLGFYASVWPSYQALTALSVTSLLPGHADCSTAFDETVRALNDNYWDQSLPGSTGAYDQGPSAFHLKSDLPRVDDSLWMGLADMQDHARTGDPASLDRAEAVFRLAQANWAPTGGIYWEATGADNHTKAVVSSAPAAVLGVELYLQTHRRVYLAWSERILDWLSTNLQDPDTGLFNDSIDDHGGRTRIDTTKYTYTEGMMVGTMAVLSVVDPIRYPLSNAVGLAERSTAYFDAHRSYGQPGFDVIWVENLLWTASFSKSGPLSAAAHDALRRALAAEPSRPTDLLTSSSEVALRQLTRLPSSAYRELLYAIHPSPDRPGGRPGLLPGG